MKPCPFCAEPVQAAAIKCKHCGSDLRPQDLPSAVAYSRRPGVTGIILLVLAASALSSALAAMDRLWFGTALSAFAAAGGLGWLAWNTGAITMTCPGCRRRIKTTLKAREIACKACGHRVRMQAIA